MYTHVILHLICMGLLKLAKLSVFIWIANEIESAILKYTSIGLYSCAHQVSYVIYIWTDNFTWYKV